MVTEKALIANGFPTAVIPSEMNTAFIYYRFMETAYQFTLRRAEEWLQAMITEQVPTMAGLG